MAFIIQPLALVLIVIGIRIDTITISHLVTILSLVFSTLYVGKEHFLTHWSWCRRSRLTLLAAQ